jgi:signal transduction histidine kinase
MFAWGLICGVLVGAIGVTIVTIIYVRRFHRLQKHTASVERLAELGTLTGGLAHEIKNPLSTVQLNLQLLQEDLDPTHPEYQRLVNRLGTVRKETTRLREILDDFMRYAGKIEVDRRPTDLCQLLDELVDFYAPQAALQRTKLRLNKPPQPVMAPVDPRLVKQAVLNLMINAAQAVGHDGEIILSCRREGKWAIVEIIDTGPGMDPETLERIFQAYYSTKKGGTGLGLAIAKRIVDEHGGKIEVKSEVGKGTDFCLFLPVS